MPVYNKEKYILNCIQNLQRQTLKDIEIIVINDHSSDRSLKILTDLAREDHRIKIVNNDKNRGLLFSRAMGILKSTGEYLMNIDPDDEIKGNNTLEYLYNKSIISKADIITFDIIYKKDNYIFKCENINETLYQPNIFNSMFFSNDTIKDFLIWNKLNSFNKKYLVIFSLSIFLIFKIDSFSQIILPCKHGKKKQIFSFWEPKEKLPGYISLCIKTWKKYLPDYEIKILDYKYAKELIGDNLFHSIISESMPLSIQADAIRVALLNKYGGIWIDADTIITSGEFLKGLEKYELVMLGGKNIQHNT